jgi:hypothetical protein
MRLGMDTRPGKIGAIERTIRFPKSFFFVPPERAKTSGEVANRNNRLSYLAWQIPSGCGYNKIAEGKKSGGNVSN